MENPENIENPKNLDDSEISEPEQPPKPEEAISTNQDNEEIIENFKKQKLLEENEEEVSPDCDTEAGTSELQPPQSLPLNDKPALSNQISFDSEMSESENKLSSSDTEILKKLEDSEIQLSNLKSELSKRDEIIGNLTQEKKMLEREKQMLKKDVDMSIREKENAVMRFAILEKNVLDVKVSKENCEKKIKELNREIELLNGKLKSAATEKTRICGMLDGKCHELKSSQKEVEKVKADLVGLETKFKWNSVKLKQEIELKFSAEKKVEELTQEVSQLKMNEIAKAKEELEVERNMLAEKQLMEQNATLILLKHGNEEKEKRIEYLEKRFKDLQMEFDSTTEKFKVSSKECQEYSQENERVKEELNDAQLLLDKQTLKIAELQSNLNDLETIKTQLTLEREENRRMKIDLDLLQTNYEEQSVELTKSREKEMELLQLNKELTETVVKLKNECSLVNSKTIAISLENEAIRKDKKYYDDIISNLKNELEEEITRKTAERQLMAQHISEKTLLAENLQKKLECALDDLEVAKKKHSQSLKELNREVLQLRKKCDNFETVAQMETKQENVEKQERDVVTSTENSSSHASDSDSQSTHNEYPAITVQEPSKKTLIDRIVRLQHAMARQTEKVDFLENHSAQLVNELQKKAKLINYYMLREQTGALASAKSDKNKAELAKYGGIMAAITNGMKHPHSSEMTLDLSLEINKKLQAVLEDTLLKNITLKENLDTLGLEVDKLTRKLASKS